MKRTIALLSAVLLISAVATAGVTNPDGFEGYALTTDWAPTLAVEGWEIGKMYGVEGGQLASIVADGGGQILDINSQGGYGMMGSPMWDGGNGVPDNAAYITTSGFEIKPLSGSMGSEFVAKFARYPDTEPWYHCTWEVGIRVSKWPDFGSPYGPTVGDTWFSAGTYVYLRTWVTDEVYTETEIPGFGLGVHLIPDIAIGPGVDPDDPADDEYPDITLEWYTMEVEEDNVNSKTRARMYLRGGAPSAWTDWQDHNAAVTYASDASQVFGWMGGQMQMDNFYITPEPATMVLLGAGSLLLIRRKRR